MRCEIPLKRRKAIPLVSSLPSPSPPLRRRGERGGCRGSGRRRSSIVNVFPAIPSTAAGIGGKRMVTADSPLHNLRQRLHPRLLARHEEENEAAAWVRVHDGRGVVLIGKRIEATLVMVSRAFTFNIQHSTFNNNNQQSTTMRLTTERTRPESRQLRATCRPLCVCACSHHPLGSGLHPRKLSLLFWLFGCI